MPSRVGFDFVVVHQTNKNVGKGDDNADKHNDYPAEMALHHLHH